MAYLVISIAICLSIKWDHINKTNSKYLIDTSYFYFNVSLHTWMHSQMPSRKIIVHVELDICIVYFPFSVCLFCVCMSVWWAKRMYTSCIQRNSSNFYYLKKKTGFVYITLCWTHISWNEWVKIGSSF